MAIENSVPIVIGIRIRNWVFSFLIRNPLFLLLATCLLLLSCEYKKEIPPPPGLLDEKKMALVISDITLSESALNNEPLASFNDTLKKINIFREHQITAQQFLLSMKYYSENPHKLKSIYEEASEILAKESPAQDTAKATTK